MNSSDEEERSSGGTDGVAEGNEDAHSEDVDAMGQPKRRQIIGQGYGPGKARQFIYYGLFIALIVGLYIGATFAVKELDVAPDKDADQAPWSKSVQVPAQRFE